MARTFAENRIQRTRPLCGFLRSCLFAALCVLSLAAFSARAEDSGTLVRGSVRVKERSWLSGLRERDARPAQ
jgi:hypothetical protein